MTNTKKLNVSPEPEVLTVDDVARTLRLGRNTTLGLIHSGQIGHVRVGTRIIVPKREVAIFLERGVQHSRQTQ